MKALKFLTLSLTVLFLLSQKTVSAQSIPTLKTAVSGSDSIKTLQYQVVALDARLTICENAMTDSTLSHKKQLAKIERQRFWKGVKRGVVGTLAIETLAALYFAFR